MSLFWRIALTFWATLMALSVLASLGLNEVARRGGAGPETRTERIEQALLVARQSLERSGPRAVQRALQRRRMFSQNFLLANEAGELLFGPSPDDRQKELLRRALSADGVVTERGVGSALSGAHRARRFAMLIVARPPNRLLELNRRGMLARLVLAAIVSGVIAWLLSRHIVRPLQNLQSVTRRLASGDLGARAHAADRGRGDELGELARDFDRMAERLQSASDAERRLLADVSHELRSPIARLQVALELARERTDGLARKELDRIEVEAGRLNHMIGQTLQLARDRSRRLALAELDLAAMLRGIVDDLMFESKLESQRVQLIGAEQSAIVLADKNILRSAIENLVRNALIHATPAASVELTLARGAAHWTIRCRDHGAGVPETELSKLFEPFFSGSGRKAGHGLGLAIAAAAVEAHGGSIAAANAGSGGLEVTVRLPISEPNVKNS